MISLFVFLFFVFQDIPFASGDEFLVQKYTVEDGLPVNSVNGILQDDDGYLWFSTLDGLVRYDGYDFRVYNSGNTDGMVINRIGGMIKTEANEIWMIHPDGTLTRKAGATFKSYSEAEGNFEGHADRVIEAKNGDIWISTTKGIFRFDVETGSFISPGAPLLQSSTWAIESTIGGGILTLNDHGLVLWEGGNASVLVAAEDFPIPAENILHIKQFNIYDVWVMGGGGLFKYSLYSNEVDFTFQTDAPQSTVWNLHLDNDGTYIINSSEGFYSWEPVTQYVAKLPLEISTTIDRINLVFRGAENERILLGDNEVLIDDQEVFDFETEEIQSGFIDTEGSLWISTLREGIFQIRKSDFSNITSTDIQGFENIYPIIQSSDGNIWAGSFVNGIYRLDQNGTDNWQTSNSNLTGNLCRFLFEDSDGTIYASMWGEGLWRYTGTDWEKINRIDELTHPNVTVEAMFRDENNRLFIGTTDQLLTFLNGSYQTFSDSISNKLQGVRVIRENSDGTLFMGTNGNGITILKDGIQRNYTTRNSNLTSNFIRDIYVQSNDTLWLATENLGLNRLILDDEANLISVKSITERDGLIKNSLHRIIETPDHHLWISSNGGIMRIAKRNLNQYTDGVSQGLSILFFDEKDGMVNREANGGVQTAGLLASDQTLWFPNQKGITVINPTAISSENSQPAPRPIIEDVVLTDSILSVESQTDIQVPYGQRNMRVKFSAPNFFAPGRINLRYKLDRVNEQWENAGQNLQAVFTNLPPGTHELIVQAHRTGNPSEISESSVTITIPQVFYETYWFYLTMAVFGILAILGGIKYRTRILENRERRLQQRVNTQTRELQEAAEQKSRFFSGITHELKTPLSLISGPLEELIENSADFSAEKVQNRLQLMNRNNKRLQDLVDQVLDVTKLNAEATSMTLQPVELPAFTRQVAGQFDSTLSEKSIQLHVHSDPIEDFVYVDPAAWERIIINLMSNAIRFSPKDSSVTINISDQKNHVSVSIKDEGIGINESEKTRIFDYLYQVEGSNSAQGTGIGLYLAKGLVEHMNGTIKVNSKKGKGAEFIITLKKGTDHFRQSDTIIHEPFIISQTEAQEVVRPEIVNGNHNQSPHSDHILVVEDNEDFREYLHSVLSEKYRVSTAPDGSSAWEILADLTPDLVISDVMMPGMNGLEFVNDLRKKEELPHLPVIFLSAKNHEIDVEAGLSSGADIYLTKPIKSSFLLSQIEAVLRRERLLKTNDVSEERNEEKPFVEQVRTIIYRQLANQSLNVDMIADTLFMSRRKLYNEWKETGAISLNDFIKKVRLEESKILLNEKGFTVQETAMAVGFSNTNYFSTSFKKEFGVTPSEVMK
ncbi:response regulator [Rhodohalobacter sp. 614A]|uniref:response regulator n=1 Tax=Rhodohalobacter sp. 614A TaxID=2908649 RepID=UPI001F3557F1|nr:response regulator [Rhodohalobacter sp. 614A]